jgi:hypothetical protein
MKELLPKFIRFIELSKDIPGQTGEIHEYTQLSHTVNRMILGGLLDELSSALLCNSYE